MFEGKTILITGGTGYLGRSLVRRILKDNPQSIRVFSRDEVKHHNIKQEFNNDSRIRSLVGDIRDFQRLKRAMEGVDIVIHAAALKRIEIIEYNVEEGINTNVIGTLNVVRACLENRVKKAIFVSTDKACSPINTYGACKFVGERIFVESNFSSGGKTIFSVVRYGNVLESTGSVIPFFSKKLQQNEVLPITHEGMTRFIISHEQAVDLVIKAIKFGIGGEIFVPKLPAFNIMDLASVLKDHHSSTSTTTTIGIRPGEKIHEAMINEAEAGRTYEFQDGFVITSQISQYRPTATHTYLDGCKPYEGKEYSSDQAVVPREELKAILNNFGVLR